MNEVNGPIHPNVNMDIMLAILSASPPKTATSIMETCQFLYHEGAKVILQEPVILYGLEHRDLALLRFIQAEDLARCSYLRSLIIPMKISESTARMFHDIVPHMSNLEGLCVGGCHLFEPYPFLVHAFASLRSMKKLILSGAGPSSCELLRTFQSQLVIANISFDFSTYSSTTFSHPFNLLRRSAPTLQKLVYTSSDHPGITNSVSYPQIIYPEVRTLVVGKNGVVPSLSSYIHALPNLVHLEIYNVPSALDEFPGLRFLEEQEQEMNVPRNSPRLSEALLAWKHIQTYTGPLSVLHTLCISFPIPQLYLTTTPGMSSPLALTEVLEYTQPTHLTITYKDQPFTYQLGPDFLSALHSDGASHLRSLGLEIELMAGDVDGNFDVGEFWTSVGTALARLQLCELCIVMSDISLPEVACVPMAGSESPRDGGEQGAHCAYYEHAAEASAAVCCSQCSEPASRIVTPQCTLAERTLEDFDLDVFMGGLSMSIRTLRNVMVSVARPIRWGGGMRTRFLGKHDDLKSKMRMDAEDDGIDRAVRETLLREGLVHQKRWFSSIVRAQYRDAAISQ